MQSEKMNEREKELQTLGEKIDELGQEILATAFAYMDRLRAGGKITEDEEATQIEMQRQFKYVESVYNRLRKSGRITDIEGSKSDGNFMDKILKRKSSISPIVVADTSKPNE